MSAAPRGKAAETASETGAWCGNGKSPSFSSASPAGSVALPELSGVAGTWDIWAKLTGEGCLSCGHGRVYIPTETPLPAWLLILPPCCVTLCLVCPVVPVSPSPSPPLEQRQHNLPSCPCPAWGGLRGGLEGGQAPLSLAAGCAAPSPSASRKTLHELRGLLGPGKGAGGAPRAEMGVGKGQLPQSPQDAHPCCSTQHGVKSLRDGPWLPSWVLLKPHWMPLGW